MDVLSLTLCLVCGEEVRWCLTHVPRTLVNLISDKIVHVDERGESYRMAPSSKYWYAENGHSVGEILETYCGAMCSLKAHQKRS